MEWLWGGAGSGRWMWVEDRNKSFTQPRIGVEICEDGRYKVFGRNVKDKTIRMNTLLEAQREAIRQVDTAWKVSRVTQALYNLGNDNETSRNRL